MMKKILLILLLIPFNVNAITASSYIVMDMDTNRVLMGENIHDERLIASISKIMTGIIAIENGNLQDEVIITDKILKGVGSSIYLEVGEKIKLKDLIYGMMMRSGNDAAIMIANTISGCEEEFANLMNKYAMQIGMNNTHFINSSGLENNKGIGNTSSSYDMAILTSYAYKNEIFREIFKTKNYTAKSDKKTYTWQNKNKLLKYDYITGGKTGYTIKAKRTLVTTASINNMNVVTVTLNDGNDFEDHLSLYKKVENEYLNYNILKKNNLDMIEKGIYLEYDLYLKNDVNLTLNDIEKNNIKVEYTLDNIDKCKNGLVGNAKIYLDNTLLKKENIYVNCYANKKTNFFKRLIKRIFNNG